MGAPLPEPILARPLRSVVVWTLRKERSSPQPAEDLARAADVVRFLLLVAASAALTTRNSLEEVEAEEDFGDDLDPLPRETTDSRAAGAETTSRRALGALW